VSLELQDATRNAALLASGIAILKA